MKIASKILCTLLIALAVAGCGVEKVENKVVSVQFPDKTTQQGVYTGEMRGDKPDGNGTFKTQNNKGAKYTYTGGFKKGMYDGPAVLQFANGARTETVYKEGAMNGKTKIFNGKVLVYEGDVVNNKYHGKGKKYDNETGKLTYDGEYKEGRAHGEGTIFKENGTELYKGKFVNGWPDVPPAKMNTPINVDNLQYSVLETKTFDILDNRKPEGVYYVVYLSVKNTDTRTRKSSNMFYYKDLELYTFVISDDKGKGYAVKEENWNSYMKHDRALSNALSDLHLYGFGAGKSVPRLALVFDIPKDAKGLKLWEYNGRYEAPPVALQ